MEIAVINSQAKVEWTPDLEKTVVQVLDRVAVLQKLGEEAEVSVVLVDDLQIRALNRQYRGQDTPTDVLSFALREISEEEPSYDAPGEDNLLGDIIISLETAREQSREYGHSLAREVGFLAVHGMLHLLGYDHQDEKELAAMRALEEDILASLELVR